MPGTDQLFDVAIVGYGPTGLVAASLLGRSGHRVVVIERWPTPYGLPRLTHIDDETARIVQGAADIDDALRDSSPTELQFVNGNDETLFTVPVAEVGPMGFPTHISMYQPDVEAAIDDRIRTMPNVLVRRGLALVDVSQSEDEVTLTVATWQDGRAADETDTVRARYLIAADGSRSAVRAALGIEREDLGFNTRWLNIDTEWLHESPAHLRGTKEYCDPRRPHMFMAIGRRRQRFEFAVQHDEDSVAMEQPDVAWRFLRDTHDLGPDDVRIVRQLVYTFEARIARRWRSGRIFLSGDAAHTMPPMIGQGACSGIRDAANLSWKLGLVLDGRADSSLLDTYELERRPHVTAVTQMSIGLGLMADERDEAAAAARDAAFRSGHVPPPPRMPIVQAGAVHHASDDSVAEPAGRLVPQGHGRIGDRHGRFDDLTGGGFDLVVRRGAADQLRADQLDFLSQLPATVIDLDRQASDESGALHALLDELGADAFLARPDLVLFGAADGPEQLEALVDELRDRLAWRDAAVPA